MKEIIHRFLDALVHQNLEEMKKIWHNQGSLEFPFAKESNKSIEGRNNLIEYFADLFENKITTNYDRPIILEAENNQFFVEFIGTHKTQDGTEYTCGYCAIAQIKNNKIYRFREFFNSRVREEYEGNAELEQVL